ncbi:MAG TPA: right-handed parallel beta-helix repeat-containing protein [Thermoanaerobaculia bacterium]|nr:right-handed parallel beta-helix repeat-containing protein [Thermoanaerobaculia bacterium]
MSASIFLSLAATTAAFATVRCVKPVPSGTGCWAPGTAFTDLQPALAASNSGDEIWVAAATYLPTTTTDRTVSFAMKNGVGIYGGFAGTETMRSQRDPSVNVTILSGDIGTQGSPSDNSYHVVTTDASVTSSGVLDGFTITAGQADGNPASNQDRGAGIWVNGGSPSLSGLIVSANFASGTGAGIRVTSASPTLLGVSILSNSVAFSGGGAGLYSGGGSSVYLQNCILRSNQISGASVGGGGIETAGSTTLVNCVIAQNSPNGMQTVAATGGNNLVIKDTTFNGNNPGYGLALFNSTGNTIQNSVFWGDTSGEIFNDGISSFAAEYSDFQGGGVPGTGNIGADPLFLNAPTDLRLGPGSPAVDAGKNLDVPGGVTLDLAGLPRFFDDPSVPDTGSGIPPIVDMGAYERIPLTVSNPSSLVLCSGAQAVFSVTAQGQPTLTYQWQKNGSPLSDGGNVSGSQTDTLTIDPTGAGDGGNYDVVVTDGFGQQLTSTTATLTVNLRPTASASGSATICAGDATPLTGSGGVACSWSPSSGLDDASSCSPNATPTVTTIYTLTVTAANGCPSNNGPTVTVTVNPVPNTPQISSPLSVPVGASGASASVAFDSGSTWNWNLAGGTITAGQTTHQIVFDAGPPGTTMVCTVVETNAGCSSPVATKNIQVDFLDIPPSNTFHDYVDTVARNGITAGCGGGNYCGTSSVTRAQMAVFLEKAKNGASFVPPSCSGLFLDVPCPGGFAVDWIEQLANDGITGGCGGGNFCPNNAVRRDQMAVFLLKALLGSAYAPPPATGTIFADVQISAFAAAWIEDLYNRNITGGCATSPLRYCPTNSNNRQQMAVFITKTFGLQ